MEATVEEPRSKEAVAREIEQNRLRIGLFLKEREQKRKASRPSRLVHALSASREAAAKYKSKAMEKAAVADQSIRNQIYPALGVAVFVGVIVGFLVRRRIKK
jgi:ElaB/YqjD/DUF883 family membrane-anchored ribosome-binding protein